MPSTQHNYRGPRIAVIGGGFWGKNLIRNFNEIGALAAVCDSRESALMDLAKQYPACRMETQFRAVIEDDSIQALAIATPAETHAPLVESALRAGKDVFVEKPLCLNVAQGRELIALARENKRILMVGHLLWYHPAIIRLKEMVDSGELGRIQYIYSNRLNLGRIRREENILWSFAPHDISVILGLLGEMPERVQAQGGNYLHQNIADVTTSLLSFSSGIKAHIFVSWLHPFKEQKLVVVGDRAMVVFNDVEEKDKLVLYPHSIGWKNQAPVANKAQARPIAVAPGEPLLAECRHFLDCVATRAQPRTDGAEALRVLEVLQRCQEAMEDKPRAAQSRVPARKYFAHESAFVDEGVEIGEGTSIWHVSHVLKGSRIGKNCKIGQNVVIGPKVSIGNGVKIQNNVSVYEGVTLEDGVFCGPSMVFTNVFNPRSEILRMNELRPTLVRHGASLGANCTVVCGITIGCYAFIGAGAVVTRDVPDHALIVGNPGRMTGWMCSCGVKLKLKGSCAECESCGNSFKQEDGRLAQVAAGKSRTAA